MSALEGYPTLQALGSELARLAEAAPQRDPRGVLAERRRALVLTILVALGLAATAAAGTLLLLRGSVIPAPAEIDVGANQVPAGETVRLLPLRAADPGAGPDWAIRVSRSETGLTCSVVGQVIGEQFGLIGLDGRFRSYAPALVDGCGSEQGNATTLLGARVFDARERDEIRTVVNGVAGDELEEVVVTAGGQRFRPPIGDGGTFVLALRGYPEDVGLRVTLRFADGHIERHPFGVAESVVLDPAGGPAWLAEGEVTGDTGPLCVRFRPVRQTGAGDPLSPPACGARVSPSVLRADLFFALRTLRSDCDSDAHPLVGGRWCHREPRTAIWGAAGLHVARIVVRGPGFSRTLPPESDGRILAVFAPEVAAGDLRVVVTYDDGRREVFTGDTNLVSPPGAR